MSSQVPTPLTPPDGPPSDPARGAVGRAADAVVQVLCAPRLSHDALRRAVIRYGRLARDVALDPTEMLGSLAPRVRACLDRVAPAEREQVQGWVQWWAIHGYHRAD
ncbi:hypothetical protein [Roseisolibacter sp. H3M3-2]|uniref:hypothetical protein n=1 Tax=Roseisolibacter sp. H3M3-2 TaxID=3031323 RepID=UPI0023DB227B|nr:hypothetical protein [Roseisolibacter sp. H3M3-2]MDF1504171.1 hypothetical protein [Roseisolibacter sp. H3M3-2]